MRGLISGIAILVGIAAALVLLGGCGGGGTVGGGNDGQDPDLGSVSGRILLGLDGTTGFEGVTVWVGVPGDARMFSGVSDADGYYVVHNVTPSPTSYQLALDINPETALWPLAPNNVKGLDDLYLIRYRPDSTSLPPAELTVYASAGSVTSIPAIRLSDEVPSPP
jgi:hypothetical protein